MVDNVSAEERRKELFEESQKYTYPEDAPGIKLRYKDTAFVLFKQSQDDPKSFLSFGTRRSSSVSQYGNTPVIVRRSRSSNGELSTVVEQWAPLHNRTSISNYTLTEAPTTEDSESDEEIVTVRNVRELQDVKEVLSEESTPEGIEDVLNDHGKPQNDKGEEGKNDVAGTRELESRKSFIHYEIPLHRHRITDSNSETVHDATNLNIKESSDTTLLDKQEDGAYKESVLHEIVTERQINEAYNLGDAAVDNLNIEDDAQDDSLPYIDAQDSLSAERMGESYKSDSIEDFYPRESPDRGNRSSIIPPPPPTKEEEEEREKDRDSFDGSKFPLLKIVEPCDLEPAAFNTNHYQPLPPLSPSETHRAASKTSQPLPPSETQPATSNLGHPLPPLSPSETQPATSNIGHPLPPLSSSETHLAASNTSHPLPPLSPLETQPAASNTGHPLPPLSPSETQSSHYILDDTDDVDFADAIIPISPKIDIRSGRSSYDASKQNSKQIPSPIKIPKSISSTAESENNAEPSLPCTTTQHIKELMPSPSKLAQSPSESKGISEMCGPTAGNGDLAKGGSCDDVNKSFDVEDRTSFLDLPIRSPTPPKKSPRRSPRSPKSKDDSHTHRSSLVLPVTTETPASVPKGSRSASPSSKNKEPGRVFTFSLKKETSKSASSLNSKKGKDKDLDENDVGAPLQEDDSQLEASGKRVGVRSMIIDGTIKRNFIVIHPSDDSDTIGLAPISSVSNGQGTTHAETPKALSSVKSHIIGLSARKVESLQKVSLKLDLKEELPDVVGSPGQVSAPQRTKRTKKKAEVHGSSHSLTSQPVMESHKELRVSRTTSQLSEIDCDSATPPSQSMHLPSPRVTSRLCSVM